VVAASGGLWRVVEWALARRMDVLTRLLVEVGPERDLRVHGDPHETGALLGRLLNYK
jgi:hypothetical protein